MQKLAILTLWVGLVTGIVAGIQEILNTNWIVAPRAWAGVAVILLLFTIAFNTRKQ